MSQIKPILNVNSNFEFGDTTGFTEGGAGVTGSFLDRQDERGNEKRQVFPPLMKSRSDYIFNGRFSRRYSIAGGGNLTLEMDATPVDPGMMVSIDIIFRTDSPGEGTGAQIRLDGLLDDATTINAVRDISATAALLHSPGNPFNYTWQAAADTIDLTGDDTPPLDLWYHVGFTVEIPQGCVSLDPIFLYLAQAAADNVVDVGQFSIQALDSRIHAGG